MVKYPSKEELLKLNPHIDEEKLEEAREILRKLRNSRQSKPDRSPLPPFARRPILVGERDKVDSRTIYLRRFT